MKSNAQLLQELLALAKSDLLIGNDVGYTMPDGQHHIYIYPDREDRWDGAPGESFFVIEPNRVVNGAHEPMGDTYLTESQDLSEVLIGCQWCMEWFEKDNRQQDKSAAKEVNIPDELTVRLAHEAGWMEAEGKTEIHDWEDLRIAIRDAITEYYESSQDHTPFCIEDIMTKILIDRFPSSSKPTENIYKEIHILICTQETDYGINYHVSLHPSVKSALAQTDSLKQNSDYDETRWNFDIRSEVVDINTFTDISPNQLLHTLQVSPAPLEKTQKPSLEDQIKTASVLKHSERSEYPSKNNKLIHSEH